MMELRIVFHMLSIFSSGIFHIAAPAALGEAAATSVSTRHFRPKRCSCATFLDKECVYFCHLDIIWVNTPERTVSYGLGNAPRKKRSVHELSRATELPRCECADSTDGTCLSFCHTRNPLSLRHKAARDKVIPTAGGHDSAEKKCKYNLAAKTSGIKRDRKKGRALSCKGHQKLLLKRWRMRQFHNRQDWAAENAAA